jgi:hypothetical protein
VYSLCYLRALIDGQLKTITFYWSKTKAGPVQNVSSILPELCPERVRNSFAVHVLCYAVVLIDGLLKKAGALSLSRIHPPANKRRTCPECV